MSTYSFSGVFGDTFFSLIVPKILGGGDYYLKLHNLENILPAGWSAKGTRHEGRMFVSDYEAIRELIEHQPYIDNFKIWNGEHIDCDLDVTANFMESKEQITKLRPRNYSNQFAEANGIDRNANLRALQIDPWMECREPRKIPGRPIVIVRGPQFQFGNELMGPVWKDLINRGLCSQAIYVGLEHEHAWFEDTFKIKVPRHPTPDFMELARVIQGSELVVASMSSPSALALALGKTMWLETRKDEPIERVDNYYPFRLNITYF